MISNVVIFDKLLDLLCALGEEGVYLKFWKYFLEIVEFLGVLFYHLSRKGLIP